jgi:hypothetical protein
VHWEGAASRRDGDRSGRWYRRVDLQVQWDEESAHYGRRRADTSDIAALHSPKVYRLSGTVFILTKIIVWGGYD